MNWWFWMKPKDCLSNEQVALAWLARNYHGSPTVLAQLVTQELISLAESRERINGNSLAAVYAVDRNLFKLRKYLVNQYLSGYSISSEMESRLYTTMHKLAEAFIQVYSAHLNRLPYLLSNKKWQREFPLVLLRSIYYRGLIAKFSHYRFEQPVPDNWQQLHLLFAQARARNLEDVEQANFEFPEQKTTLSKEYLQPLLLQLANSGDFAPNEIEWIAYLIDKSSRRLELTLEPANEEGFIVDLTSMEGMRRRHDTTQGQGGEFLFLDTMPLYARLQRRRKHTMEELKTPLAQEALLRARTKLKILTKLLVSFAPHFAPFPRSGQRHSQYVRAHSLLRFKPICEALARSTVQENKPWMIAGNYTYTNSAMFRTYGFVDQLADKIKSGKELERPPSTIGEPCRILDRSETGFRVLLRASQIASKDLGGIVALNEIQAEVQQDWQLGIVRRIKKLDAKQAEIGVEKIAKNPSKAILQAQRPDRESLRNPSRQVSTLPAGNRYEGLCFDYVPSKSATHLSKSIIIPRAEYKLGQLTSFQQDGYTAMLMFRRLLSQHNDWVWVMADVLTETGEQTPQALAA